MARLRKAHTKLKIVLCCVLGFIVAAGGAFVIWYMCSALGGDKVVEAPDDTENLKIPVAEGMTFSTENPDGLTTIGHLAWMLDQQQAYHSSSTTVSTALIATQYTNSFKDYKDGIMLSSDFTYGFVGAGTQSCFVPNGNAEGKGAGVYMRTSSGNVGSSTTGTNADWKDDVVYYDKESYLYKYGQYSTEMTVYILNAETVESWNEATANGDGTFTQTFNLNAEKAAYYYQYAMQTRGGLDKLPEFSEISLTITFDDNYRVLSIEANEKSDITRIFAMSSTSVTDTVYTYDEESFDEAHYDYYESYYSEYVGNLGVVDDPGQELTAADLLLGAFGGVIGGTGDQFDATLVLNDKTYYGKIFLSVDISSIGDDILGAIEARIALSSDESVDGQDLYIELADGNINAYYSTDFALTADVNAFGDIIEKFSAWADSLGNTAAPMADTAGEEGGSLDLNEILAQLLSAPIVETEEGVSLTLSLEDLMGVSLSATFDFTDEGNGIYSLGSAAIGGLSYNDTPISVSVGLTPSEGEFITHQPSEAPFDISKAADSLYQLLSSETIRAQLQLGGSQLADLLEGFGVDLGNSLDDLKLEITGGVDIGGITVDAAMNLYSDGAEGQKTLLAANVYYIYNGGAGRYGTAYLAITNLLGAECDLKVYADIDELKTAIEALVAEYAPASYADGGQATDIASLINAVLSLDFGSVIKEINADSGVIGATLNVDGVLEMLGAGFSVGDITLKYTLGALDAEGYNGNGGWLYGSIPSLGIQATIYGSEDGLTEAEKDDYLELTEALQSVLALLNSPSVDVNITLSGDALAQLLADNGINGYGELLDGANLVIKGNGSIKDLDASVNVTLTDKDEKVLLAADVFYDYDTTAADYGKAYITISKLLGADCNINVYCNISEVVSTVQSLIDGGAVTLDEVSEEGQGIVDIISQLLDIQWQNIIKSLSSNADRLTTTLDLDEVLSLLGADVNVGLVTLGYDIENGELTGNALNGGLTIIVNGNEDGVKSPEDISVYTDANKLLNSVIDLLNKPSVGVELTLTGDALAQLLADNGIKGYGNLLNGASLVIVGNGSLKDLDASVNVTLTAADKKVLLAADVYYDYDTTAADYGKTYITISKLLGADCNINVYCNISEVVSTVQSLIDGGVVTLDEVSEEEQGIADIIAQLLDIQWQNIIKSLSSNADKLTTTLDLDEVLSLLGADVNVGLVTLGYDIENGELTGNALNGGLTIIVNGNEDGVKSPEDISVYTDANKLLNSVIDLLNKPSVGVELSLTGDALAQLLADNGINGYGELLNGASLVIVGNGSLKDLDASANITLTAADNKVLLAADVYYDYDTTAADYGKAYITISKLLGVDCSINVYCNISEVVSTVQSLINGGVVTLDEVPEEEQSIADIIAQLLDIQWQNIIKSLSSNADRLTTTLDLDEVLSLLDADVNVGLVTLGYDIENGEVTGNALGGGLTITVNGSEDGVEKPNTDDYTDADKLLNSVIDLLNSESVGVELTLTGDALAQLLADNGINGYGELLSGASLVIVGNGSLKDLDASANITLTDKNEKVLLAADVYYDYDTTTADYGKAYITISKLLGADCNINVYCNISEVVSTVQSLIGGGAQAQTISEEEQGIVDIITKVLGIEWGSVIKELATDANGLTTTIDLDYILGTLVGSDVKLGLVKLSYDLNTDTLTGNALGAGLTIIVNGNEDGVEKPNTDDYTDADKLLNSVIDLLNKPSVGVELTLTGDALAQLLADNGINGYGELLNGASLVIVGNGSLKDLDASANITLTAADNKVLLAADVYYDYDTTAADYGKAYITISKLLGADCNINVYCNISEVVATVQSLINGGVVTLDEVPEEEQGIVDIISQLLDIQWQNIIKSLSSNADRLTTTLDLDEVLSLLDADVKVGLVTLGYDIENGELTGNALDGGLTIIVNGNEDGVEKPNTDDYTDADKLLNSVIDLLNKPSVGVELSLTGDALAQLLADNGINGYGELLNGASLVIVGNGSLKDLDASVNITLTAADKKVLLCADVYYDYNAEVADYGKAYITISKLLGADCNINVYCNISEVVSTVQSLIGGGAQAQTISEEEQGIVDIITKVLGIEWSNIIKELATDANGLTTTIDLDYILGTIVGSDVKLGLVTLGYDLNTDTLTGGALFSGTGEKETAGLTITVSGSETVLSAPDIKDYIDINDVLEVVANAIAAIENISSRGEIYFSLENAEIAVNGIYMGINGRGEAKWNTLSGDLEALALDLTLFTADGAYSTRSGAATDNTTEVELIYNALAADSEPLVRLAINGSGIDIYRRDIDQFESDINKLIASINNLLGGNTAKAFAELSEEAGSAATGVPDDITPANTDMISVIKFVLDQLSGEGLAADIFGGLLSGSVEVDGTDIIAGLFGSSLTIGAAADGTLKLEGDINVNGTDLFNIAVSAGVSGYGNVNAALTEAFAGEGYTFTNSAETEGGFTRMIYDYILGAFGTIDIGKFLGSKTYSVDVYLSGDGSKVPALAGISVDATLTFTRGFAEDGSIDPDKFASAALDITVNGFKFAANVFAQNGIFYVMLTNINGTELSDLNVQISADGIYSLAENIVALINSEDVQQIIALFMGGATGENAKVRVAVMSEEQQSGLEGMLEKLLSFDYSKYVTAMEDGAVVADINGMLAHFGVNADIGKARLKLTNTEGNKSVALNIYRGDNADNGWFRLTATAADGSTASVPDVDFVDIDFIGDLVKDLGNLIASGKKPSSDGLAYTFYEDSIELNVAGLLSVTISNIYVTINIDGNGGFYLSAQAHLGAVSGLAVVAASSTESDIAITYSNGYLTLVRDRGTADEIYWVMTPEYFIDHLFAHNEGTSDSPLRWLTRLSVSPIGGLFGISDWNDLADMLAAEVNLSSGLATEQRHFMYDTNAAAISTADADAEKTSISQFISAMSVLLPDSDAVSLGDADAVSSLISNLGYGSAANGYYAFSLNGNNLTGGALTVMDMGIRRDENRGIASLDVFLSVSGTIDIKASLEYLDRSDGNYFEVSDYFITANAKYEEIERNNPSDNADAIDFGYSAKAYDSEGFCYGDTIFGGVKIEPNSDNKIVYDYTYILVDGYVTVKIYDTNGTTLLETISLRRGSTIYFFDGTNSSCYDENGDLIVYQNMADGSINSSFAVTEREYSYRKFSLAAEKTVNGVVYTFVGSTAANSAPHYAITGTTADIESYYSEGTTLVLENTVSGLPVSEIYSEVFSGKSLKNVVVPENVIYVGEKAFMDNYGMVTAVFLAESVQFAGSAGEKNYPFYGCSKSDGSADTSLTVYFNTIVYSDGMQSTSSGEPDGSSESETTYSPDPSDKWNYYRESRGGWTVSGYQYTHYYLPSYGANTWTYISNYSLEISGQDSQILCMDEEAILRSLRIGVVTADISGEIQAQVLNNINNYTADHNYYINAFTVTVKPVEMLSGCTTIVVSIKYSPENAYYPSVGNNAEVVVDGNKVGLTISYTDTAVVVGTTFVRYGSDVTVQLSEAYKADYVLVSVNGVNAVNGVVTLPFSQDMTVEAVCEVRQPEYVAIYSEVPVYYENNGQNVVKEGGGNIYMVPDFVFDSTGALPAVTTTTLNHYFLGWATKDGENYVFTTAKSSAEQLHEFDSSATYSAAYYAIWAYNSATYTDGDKQISYVQSVTPVKPDEPTASLSSADITLSNAGFAGWYSDEGFVTSIGEISTSTIVYARLQFTFTISFKCGSTNITCTSGDDICWSASAGDNTTLSHDIKVAEGGSITVSFTSLGECGYLPLIGTHISHKWTAKIDIVVSDGINDITHVVETSSTKGGNHDRRPKSTTTEAPSGWEGSYTLDHDENNNANQRISSGAISAENVNGYLTLVYEL